MKNHLLALGSGILFGVGLAVSHMIDPSKVQNFLDIAGDWDPSLLFVMAGALGVAITGFRFARSRPSPLWSAAFQLPSKRSIDRKLLAGSAIFGIGWGLSGFCPGPSMTALSSLSFEPVVMIVSIYLGFFVYRRWFDNI